MRHPGAMQQLETEPTGKRRNFGKGLPELRMIAQKPSIVIIATKQLVCPFTRMQHGHPGFSGELCDEIERYAYGIRERFILMMCQMVHCGKEILFGNLYHIVLCAK